MASECMYIERDACVITAFKGRQKSAFALFYPTLGEHLFNVLVKCFPFQCCSLNLHYFCPEVSLQSCPCFQKIETFSFTTKFIFHRCIWLKIIVSTVCQITGHFHIHFFLNLHNTSLRHVLFPDHGSGIQGKKPKEVQWHLSITSSQALGLFHAASDPVR